MAVSTAGMVARRRFGEALKAARLKAQNPDGGPVKQTDAARVMKRKTIDRISRLERGAAWPEPNELEALLKLYNADLETGTRLRTMLKEGQAIARAWWQEYEDEFPDSLIQFIAYEDAAQSIVSCGGNVLPSLLQTENYARSLTTGVAGSVLPTDAVERSVELRRRRRAIFDKQVPTRVEFIFSEAALRQQAGGPDVMTEQLEALLDDVQSRPVTVRVVPFSAAAPAMYILHLLEFSGGEEKPIAAFDSKTGMTFQTQQREIRETKYYIEAMRKLASSPEDSVSLIKTIKKEMSSARVD